MARSVQQLSYSAFTGGIVTEASPLTFPDGASIDESNFELTKQGTRNRRLGLDKISESVDLTSRIGGPKDVVTYLWDNNGNTGQVFLVVVAFNELMIYDVTSSTPGENLVYKTTISGNGRASLTSHAGQLIVATGKQDILVIRVSNNNVFSERVERLTIRDRVGLPAYTDDPLSLSGKSLLNAAKSAYRPKPPELFLRTSFDWERNEDVSYNVTYGPDYYVFNTKEVVLSNKTLPNGDVVTRTKLNTANTLNAFMGWPIEAFLLERNNPAVGAEHYSFTIVFREQFYSDSIEAQGISAVTFNQIDGGVEYTIPLTLSEYNSFYNLDKDLVLVEFVKQNHPHLYNLFNQGWGKRRMDFKDTTNLYHPIDDFFVYTKDHVLPAASDDVNVALYENTQLESNRTAQRFHPQDLEAMPLGSYVSPLGRFVIDALVRGQSRFLAYRSAILESNWNRIYDVKMNYEYTTGGATSVADYAGRVWFAGFSGDSPGSTISLSNKVLYGQTSDDNIFSCYQETDPTIADSATVLETDGGYISIDSLDKVVHLVAVDTVLMVFATNGVWAIAGSDGNSFSPTSSTIIKLTDKGAVNAQSIVQVDSDVYFWAKDGLYKLQSKGFAEFDVVPMTKLTINEIAINLTSEDVLGMSGAYDERKDTITWIIDGSDSTLDRRELVFHLAFQSFTINTLYSGTYNDGTVNQVLAIVKTPQFISRALDDNVKAGSDNVVADSDNVVVDTSNRDGGGSRTAYIAVFNGLLWDELMFVDKVRDDFSDWGLTDAKAYLLTGYVTGGDTARMKGVPSLVCHFNRTEGLATETGAESESSCLVQSQWEWTNSAFANKWSAPFQAYRHLRPQISGLGEEVAEGIQVVTTRNKLRGRGRTVSLLFSTEEGKDCQILGWSMMATANNIG